MQKQKQNNINILPAITVLVILSLLIIFFIFNRSSSVNNNPIWRNSAPTIGSVNAPINMVEFGDFVCEACTSFTNIINQLVSDYPTKVNYQFRYFPNEQKDNAFSAAQYAEIAHMHGKFWEMYDMLMQNQNSWSESGEAEKIFTSFLTLINAEDINSERDKKLALTVVQEDLNFAVNNDLVGTPTLFINNKIYQGELSYAAIKSEIDKLLTD